MWIQLDDGLYYQAKDHAQMTNRSTDVVIAHAINEYLLQMTQLEEWANEQERMQQESELVGATWY